jgi:hypothetical protein
VAEGSRIEQKNEQSWKEMQLDDHEKRKTEEWKIAKKKKE